MKKILLWLLLIIPVFGYGQQLPNLDRGHHVPNYWYNKPDTSWWDYISLRHRIVFTGYVNDPRGQQEVARYCYSRRPLKIIGIAAPADARHYGNNTSYCLYPADSSRVPEFFNLYEVDGNSELVPLATVRWDTAKPRFKMFVDGRQGRYSPVYEAYFEEPIEVVDSFYVSATSNNNKMLVGDSVPAAFTFPYAYTNKGTAYYFSSATARSGSAGIYVMPDGTQKYIDYNSENIKYAPMDEKGNYMHFKYRYHHRDFFEEHPSYEYGWFSAISDTVWHTRATDMYINIFPIFDTTGMYLWENDTCPAASNLRVVTVDIDSATLTWDWDTAGTPAYWELMLSHTDKVDSDTIIRFTNNLACLANLDSATWYYVKVRSICHTGDYDVAESGWSDSVRFFVPGDTVKTTCPSTTGLRIMEIDANVVTLTWDAQNTVSRWELLLVPADLPDDDTILVVNNNVATVSHLDTATWYYVRVRSICDSGDYERVVSPWSDSVMFYIAGDTAGHTTAIASGDDRSVTLTPNPASTAVVISASTAIQRIDFLNMQGRTVRQMELSANSLKVDTRDLPSGVYTIRIVTSHGTSVRKLTVTHKR